MRSIKTGFSAFLLLTFLSVSALAATFTVTKTADTNDGTCDADCSLREAVAAANAAGSDDSIVFSSLFDSPQIITLSGTEIVINNAGTLTITGPGANLLTVSGNNTSRIFQNTVGAVTSMSGMTLTGGNGVSTFNNNSGGAIQNSGTMTLTAMIITGNTTSGSAGGIRNSSTGSQLTINGCIISNNTSTGSSAGGIQNFSTSTLTVNNTTFTGNLSGGGSVGGGAMQVNGTARITNSTFSGNTSNTTGGGGAMNINGSSIVITNVTISGNSAPNNGGGIHRGTTNANFFIRNTIIAGNNGTAASPDITNSTGGLQSQGNNIIGNVGTSTGWVASDLLNTAPLLGALADNGGFGQTFLPQAGSPAIDGGQNCVRDLSCKANNPPAAVTDDQRGVSRTTNGNVDIGSVEVAAVAPVSVSGQVLVAEGVALPLALVSITDGNETRYFITNSFGYFNFEGLSAGTEYTITVSSKAANYPPLLVTPTDDIDGIIFLPIVALRADSK